MRAFFVALLVGVIVFLAVMFILNPLLPGIGVYAGVLGVLAALAYFFGEPYLRNR